MKYSGSVVPPDPSVHFYHWRRDCDLNPGPSAPEYMHANHSATEPPYILIIILH